jgi:hypothetical protein
MMMFNIGERVVVDNVEGLCTVVGHGFYQQAHHVTTTPAYIIRMDRGTWTADGYSFIDTIVVHPDNVRELGE